MEKEKKVLKDASYFFYFLAVLDVLFVVIAVIGLKKADVASTASKATVAGMLAGCAIDLVFDIYLGAKGLAVVKGTYAGQTHVKVSLVLLVLEVISVPFIIYSIVKGEYSWITLAQSAVSIINVWEYYSNSKKLAA